MSDTALSNEFLVKVSQRKRHPLVSLFHEVEEAARKKKQLGGWSDREPKFPVLILAEEGRSERFIVAPMEAAYLRVLLTELERVQALSRREGESE